VKAKNGENCRSSERVGLWTLAGEHRPEVQFLVSRGIGTEESECMRLEKDDNYEVGE
jgi:hypothetical protein